MDNLSHFMYADDLIIFSPNIERLKLLLLYKCEEYSNPHFINFNPLKNVIMILRSIYLKNRISLDLYLCDEPIQIQNSNIWVFIWMQI